MKTRVQNNNLHGEYSRYGTVRDQKPRMGSILRARVLDNNDPDNLCRVRVEVPALDRARGDLDKLPWAPVLQLGASGGSGSMIVPEVGSVVLVLFEGGDPSKPVVIGSAYGDGGTISSQYYNTLNTQKYQHANSPGAEYVTGRVDAPSAVLGHIKVPGRTEVPIEGQDVNHVVLFKSRSGNVIYMDDTAASDDIIIKGQSGACVRIRDGEIQIGNLEKYTDGNMSGINLNLDLSGDNATLSYGNIGISILGNEHKIVAEAGKSIVGLTESLVAVENGDSFMEIKDDTITCKSKKFVVDCEEYSVPWPTD